MSDVTQGQFVQDLLIQEEQGNRISEVVVFTDQAYLKRQARVEALPGLNRFVMDVQAFMVDTDSAQATVYGDGDILSVQYTEIPVKEMPQEDVRALQLKREEIIHQQNAVKSQKDVYERQRRFLDSMICVAEVEVPKEIRTQFPKTDEMKAAFEFLGETFQGVNEQTLELDRKLEDLNKELAVVEMKLKQLRKPGKKTQKGIEVLFESGKEQEIQLEVSYVALNASWEAVYKVDVPLDLSTVRLTMFAKIQQKSGEHWQDIKLAVSNAVPLKGAALPEAQSWYLNLRPKAPAAFMAGAVAASAPMAKRSRKKREAQVDEYDLEEAMELSDTLSEPEAEFIQAEQKELPLAFEYELPQIVTIESGGGETILPLYTKEMQGEFFVYAAPRHDPLAYLVCRSSADRELLAGRLNIHFGGRFVGGTALKEKKAGEDLLVNLGVERGVKVQREKVTDKLAETFFGVVDRLSAARELEYRIVIESLKNESVRVHLFDSIPVSEIDRIQVKDVELVPEPTEKDYQKKEGVMLWKFSLEPKAKSEIRLKCFVKHPKDSPPQGL